MREAEGEDLPSRILFATESYGCSSHAYSIAIHVHHIGKASAIKFLACAWKH